MRKRILVVEPYYGGSHKQFLIGLSKIIDAEFIFLTLPARKWKMRMQLSAPWFVDCIKNLADRCFDTVLCSTFVDVAVLKAMLTNVEDWNSNCIFCTYFHENQFAYPSQIADRSLQQFTALNFTTALTSDKLAFNSEYNRNTFFDSSARYIKRSVDMDLRGVLHQIEEKSTILYPGVDFDGVYCKKGRKDSIPVICWNHRWEHDKDPDSFFRALYELEKRKYEFKIIVLGQSFQKNPDCFSKAKDHFKNKTIHFGYAESRDEYLSLLQRSDIVVSTALHEFFGISIVEAVHYGCIPVVPDRLSYPELYPKKYRYNESGLVEMLAYYLENIEIMREDCIFLETVKYSWKVLESRYHKWLFDNTL